MLSQLKQTISKAVNASAALDVERITDANGASIPFKRPDGDKLNSGVPFMQEVRARPKASVLQPLGKKLRAMIALKKGELDAMLPGQSEAFRRSPLFRDHYHNIDPSVSARSDSSDE